MNYFNKCVFECREIWERFKFLSEFWRRAAHKVNLYQQVRLEYREILRAFQVLRSPEDECFAKSVSLNECLWVPWNLRAFQAPENCKTSAESASTSASLSAENLRAFRLLSESLKTSVSQSESASTSASLKVLWSQWVSMSPWAPVSQKVYPSTKVLSARNRRAFIKRVLEDQRITKPICFNECVFEYREKSESVSTSLSESASVGNQFQNHNLSNSESASESVSKLITPYLIQNQRQKVPQFQNHSLLQSQNCQRVHQFLNHSLLQTQSQHQ